MIQSGDPPSLKFRRASLVYMYLFDPDPRFGSPAGALAEAGGDWIINFIPLAALSRERSGSGTKPEMF